MAAAREDTTGIQRVRTGGMPLLAMQIGPATNLAPRFFFRFRAFLGFDEALELLDAWAQDRDLGI